MTARTSMEIERLGAREVVEMMQAIRRQREERGLPEPGSADALLHYLLHEPKPIFEPGEMERLLEETQRLREEDQ